MRIETEKRNTGRRLCGNRRGELKGPKGLLFSKRPMLDKGVTQLIFDTSGINALTDDLDCLAILAGLRSAYLVGVTGTVMFDFAANTDETLRI